MATIKVSQTVAPGYISNSLYLVLGEILLSCFLKKETIEYLFFNPFIILADFTNFDENRKGAAEQLALVY